MRFRGVWVTVFSIAAWLTVLAAYGDEVGSTQKLNVSETYNQKPFEYQMKLLAKRDGFRIYRVTYPSPVTTSLEQNNTVKADYYVPEGLNSNTTKRPAVVMLHILNGDMRVTDVACSVLAKRGIPAIMPTLPYYGERAYPEGFEPLLREPQLFMGMLFQSVEDLRRTADLLASRPEVNAERLGICGMSLGGIVSGTVAATDSRFYRTSMFLAGGDLLAILRHAKYTKNLSKRFDELSGEERTAMEAKVKKVDPLYLAPALRDRAQQGRVQMINSSDDEIIPRATTEKLAAALGIADRVVWIYGLEHDRFIAGLPQALRKITDFFAQDLPAEASAGVSTSVDEATPLRHAAALIHQVSAVMSSEPAKDRCHLVELDIAAGPKNQKPFETQVRFVRGASNRFALKCKLPVLGEVTLGQSESPWMVTGGQSVLLGVKNPGKSRNPLSLASPDQLAKVNVVAGLIGSLDLVPDALGQWVVVEAGEVVGGNQAIRITAKEKFPGSVWTSFQSDGKTPAQIKFDVPGVDGKVEVRGWKVNAPADDAMFNPPKELKVVEVEQADLYKTFAMMFNLVVQQAK